MKVSWVWVAQAAVYVGLSWIVVTTIVGAFGLGFKPSLDSLSIATPLLLILMLCLIGLRSIVNRFSEALGPRKAQKQREDFQSRVPWSLALLIAVYGGLVWVAAGTTIGEFLVFMLFSLPGLIFVLASLLILTLWLIADLSNRNQTELLLP